jgi:hypothetical protein
MLSLSVVSDVIRELLIVLMALAASGHVAYYDLCCVYLFTYTNR